MGGPENSQSHTTGSSKSKWAALKSVFTNLKRKSQSHIVENDHNNDDNENENNKSTNKRTSRLSTMFRNMSISNSKTSTSRRSSSVSLASVANFVRQSLFFGKGPNQSNVSQSPNKTAASNMAAMLKKGKGTNGSNQANNHQNQSGSGGHQSQNTHGASKFGGKSSSNNNNQNHNQPINSIQKRIEFLKSEDFNYIKEVDSGAFSTIYQCYTYDSNDRKYDVAIKRVSLQRKSNAKFLSRFLEREVLIHCALKHPNIVRYYDTLLNDGYDIYLVLEWIDKGNLLDYCRLVGRLDEETTQNLSFQLFHALAYMHNNYIVHRDIKCENILIKTQTPALHVKLADFGFCRYIGPRSHKNSQGLSLNELVDQSRCIELHDAVSEMSKLSPSLVINEDTAVPENIKNLMSKESNEKDNDILEESNSPNKTHPSLLCKTFCGSLAYSAPELVMGKLYDGRKIDVWSVGCVVFILLTHRMAFKEKGGHQNLILQQKAGIHWPSSVIDEISELAKDFVCQTLTFEDRDRPHAQELLDKHPFVANEMREFKVTKKRLSEMPKVAVEY